MLASTQLGCIALHAEHTWPLRNVALCICWIPEVAIIGLEHVVLAVGRVLSFPSRVNHETNSMTSVNRHQLVAEGRQ